MLLIDALAAHLMIIVSSASGRARARFRSAYGSARIVTLIITANLAPPGGVSMRLKPRPRPYGRSGLGRMGLPASLVRPTKFGLCRACPGVPAEGGKQGN